MIDSPLVNEIVGGFLIFCVFTQLFKSEELIGSTGSDVSNWKSLEYSWLLILQILRNCSTMLCLDGREWGGLQARGGEL